MNHHNTDASWKPRDLTAQDTLTAGPALRLAATLDKSDADFYPGNVLPELWHWLYFLPADPQSRLAGDGHPHKGSFLPPVSLPRRMWAGSELIWHDTLTVGAHITRTSTVAGQSEKQGASGRLVFVNVRHRYEQDTRPVLTEMQTLVYRDAAHDTQPPSPVSPPPVAAQFSRRIVPDEKLLFRYSALTFNSHRIHYDAAYARETEGYPALVLHGPLIATFLMDLLKTHQPGCRVNTFNFRALRPLLVSSAFTVNGALSEGIATLWAEDSDGNIAMKATAHLQ